METKMSNRKWILGGIGLLAVVVATLTVPACDPYNEGVGGAPYILGVAVLDVNDNQANPGDEPGCRAPYPQVDEAWAQATYPGTCGDTVGPSMCPVNCFPPRMGPAYAPYFAGNLGGSYQCDRTDPNCLLAGSNGTYVFGLPTAWTLRNVPPAGTADGFQFSRIFITFNKMMLGTSIQSSSPTGSTCTAAAGISVTANGVDVTSDFDVCYWPNSWETYAGASMSLTPKADSDGVIPELAPATTYRVGGNVSDQDGNALALDVTVITD